MTHTGGPFCGLPLTGRSVRISVPLHAAGTHTRKEPICRNKHKHQKSGQSQTKTDISENGAGLCFSVLSATITYSTNQLLFQTHTHKSKIHLHNTNRTR